MSAKFLPSSVGAEPKKLAILGGLLVIAGLAYYMSSGSDVPPGAKGTTSSRTTLPKAGDSTVDIAPINAPRPTTRSAPRRGSDEFRPTLKVPDDFDLREVDPTLNLAKLEQVRAVGQAGGRRSLFEFYTPPPPPPPKTPPIVPTEPKPELPKAVAPSKPVTPPPPPIPVKFYGYAGKPGGTERRALFVDGEEIFIKAESELIRDRYKIVRINVNSAEVEDTVSKNRQTLPIVEPFEK